MTIILQFPDGTEENTEIKYLRDLTRTSPGLYLYDEDNNRTIRRESFVLEQGRRYIVRGNIDVSPENIVSNKVREMVSSIDKSVLPKSPYQSPKIQKKSISYPNINIKKNQRINELIQNEEKYLKALNILYYGFRSNFLRKVNDEDNLGLTLPDVNFLFKDMISLITNGDLFLNDLKNIINTEINPQIGNICLWFSKSLKVYTSFITEFNDKRILLLKLKENPNFCEFLKSIEEHYRDEIDGNSFLSILVFPVQRVPKYIMFFQSILDHTLRDSEEYSFLKESIVFCNEAAIHSEMISKKLDDAKIVYEETKHIIVPESLSHCTLLENNRTFLFKQEMKISTICGPKLNVIGLVFNDCMMLVNTKKKCKYTLCKFIKYECIQFVHNNQESGTIQLIYDNNSLLEIIPKDINQVYQILKPYSSFIEEENIQDFKSKTSKPMKNRSFRRSRNSINKSVKNIHIRTTQSKSDPPK